MWYRRVIIIVLSLLILSMSSGSSLVNIASAEEPYRSIYDDYFPSRETLGIPTDEQLLYEQYPLENYTWDTNLSVLKWKGIRPSFEDTGPIMDNNFASMALKISNGITRMAIFVFEFTFNSNFILIAVEEIADAVILMKDIFLTNFYGLFSLVLLTFIILAYARGLNGLAFKHLFVSLILVALLSGIVENIKFFVETGANVSDSVSSYVIGTVNLAPFQEEEAREIAELRMIATSNELWRVNVLYPWRFGQFGSIIDPVVTTEERVTLYDDHDIAVSVGESWTDLMLTHPPKEETREAYVEVLVDPEMDHSSSLNPRMFGAVGAGGRMITSAMSVITATGSLLLYLAVGGFLLLGSFVVLIGVAFMPIFVVVPLLASIGTNILKKYISLLIAGFALEISAAFYLGSIILAKQLVNLLAEMFSTDFLIVQFLYIVIYIFGIIFSPKIITMLMPVLYKIGTFQNPASTFGKDRRSSNSSQTLEPQNSEEVIERNQSFGKNKSSRTANAVDFTPKKVPADQSSDRSKSVKELLDNGKKYQANATTVFDSMTENRKQALKGLQQEHADILTTQKVSIDNPEYYGDTNPISDKLDKVEVERLEQAIEKEIHAQIKEDIRNITSRENFRHHHLRDEIFQLLDGQGKAKNHFAEMKIRKLEREYSKQYKKFLRKHTNGDLFYDVEGDVVETSQRIRDLG